MEKLLYFAAGNRDREKQLEAFARAWNLEFTPVTPLQTGQQLGYLAGLAGFAEKKLALPEMPPKVTEEVLILDGINGERLDRVLQGLRSHGMSISLKAILTPHNIGWTFAALYQELTRERAQFEK